MSKILIIAEKPSVASKISQALQSSNKKKKDGYIEDDKYIISWCLGHLFEQKKPSEVDETYKTWSLNTLPFKFDKIPNQVRDDKGCKAQVKALVTLLKRDDVTEVVDACDADREGEGIFREVITHAKSKIPHSRMWIESMADNEVIKDTFKTRKKGSLYNNLSDAQKGRSFGDYHICLNGTMGMSAKNNKTLPLGRVQTPTLNMVVLLEREIQNFKSKPFWTVNADTDKGFNAKYFNEDLPNNQFTNIDDAKNLIKNVGIGKAKVIKASISKRQEKAPRLFNLSDLQIEMNRRYKMSAQTVLDSCQRLYETYGLTTYPRTDENHISQELAETVNSIIKALPSVFKKQKDEIIKNKYKINSSCVAKKEIGAHEALTPTTKNADSVIDDLNDVDLKVYQAITERFLINFYPNAVFNVQEIEIERNKAHFKAKFESINDKGYYNGLLKEKEFTEQEFVDVDEGDYVNITKLNLEEGKTNPPSRFTEGTLIKTMANPLKYVEDAHDKEVLKETKGLGTEATRASVIEGLKVRKYIEVDKKGVITPTDLGMQTIDNAPNLMKSIPLTVMMEDSLALISVGKKDLDEYKQEVYELCDKIIDEIKKSENIKAEEKGDGKMAKNEICKCPNCGGSIVEGKYGFGCSDWKNCKVLIKFDAYKRFGVEKVTKTIAKQLLTKGQTKDKQECYSASKGTNYDAYLTYEFNENEQYPNSTGIKFK